MLVYFALANGTPPDAPAVVEDCWRRLERNGDHLAKDGKRIEDKTETVAALEQSVPEVLSVALPLWRRIGAI